MFRAVLFMALGAWLVFRMFDFIKLQRKRAKEAKDRDGAEKAMPTLRPPAAPVVSTPAKAPVAAKRERANTAPGKPRQPLDEAAIGKRLGLPPGPTMLALVAAAERTRPDAPEDAFQLLWFHMRWLNPESTIGEPWWSATPRNVHPFAETGGDGNHFGFLMDGDVPMEDRPIVFVAPRYDDEGTQVIASNLAAFLGLLTVAFGEVMDRNATDEEWFGFRKKWWGDDPQQLADLERLSDVLCTIPGVMRPESPSQVAKAHPDQPFRLGADEDYGEEDDDGAAPGPDAAPIEWGGPTAAAQKALEAKNYAEAHNLAERTLNEPAHRPRSMFIHAAAASHLGKTAEAKAMATELLRDWRDNTPMTPPAVHARRVLDADEMIWLLELVGMSKAALAKELRGTPDVGDPEGDFI